MNVLEQTTIGEYVAKDFRTAAIFSKYSIDFCCKGNRTIEEACENKNLDSTQIEKEIVNLLASKSDETIDFKSWPTDFLIDYIEKMHHRYVREKAPVLITFLTKLCKVHGQNHPELFEIKELFDGCVAELGQHMIKEETVLFPYIKKMDHAIATSEAIEQPHFGTVENPIAMMKDEHVAEGERFVKIAALTNNYVPPADACNTYKVTFSMLQEFEQDLHKHIHLENNILFLRAVEMQSQFA